MIPLAFLARGRVWVRDENGAQRALESPFAQTLQQQREETHRQRALHRRSAMMGLPPQLQEQMEQNGAPPMSDSRVGRVRGRAAVAVFRAERRPHRRLLGLRFGTQPRTTSAALDRVRARTSRPRRPERANRLHRRVSRRHARHRRDARFGPLARHPHRRRCHRNGAALGRGRQRHRVSKRGRGARWRRLFARARALCHRALGNRIGRVANLGARSKT